MMMLHTQRRSLFILLLQTYSEFKSSAWSEGIQRESNSSGCLQRNTDAGQNYPQDIVQIAAAETKKGQSN